MKRLNSRLKPYLALSELETIYYNIYQHPSPQKQRELLLNYSNTVQNDNFIQMFQSILNKKGFIPEATFFQNTQTITINCHPAICLPMSISMTFLKFSSYYADR